MFEQNDKIFALYKPFRNQLRKFELFDSLYVFWAYARNLTFDNKPLPPDIELPQLYHQFGDLSYKRINGIHEIELDFLIKEAILNCEALTTEHSLKKLHYMRRLINYLRHDFKNGMIEVTPLGDDGIFREFFRMMHDQFKWFNSFNIIEYTRYYKIFSEETLRPYVEAGTGLPIFELFIIGIMIHGMSGEKFRHALPLRSTFSLITNEMIERFFVKYSITVEEAKIEIKKNQQMNENLFYSYNPLYAKPIIRDKDSFICPMTQLLFMQITGGTYYQIDQAQRGFDKAFGNSFEKYIGSVLEISCDPNRYSIFPEAQYGVPQKDTTDWILEDDHSVMFIECKTKRITLLSKSELDPAKGLEKDLKKMAEFICQLYKTYHDYVAGLYPQIEFNRTKQFVPLVVTLEEWYIGYHHIISDTLRDYVTSALTDKAIDPAIIDRFPYFTMSCSDFEKNIQVINTYGIRTYFNAIRERNIDDLTNGFTYKVWHKEEFKTLFLEPLGHTDK